MYAAGVPLAGDLPTIGPARCIVWEDARCWLYSQIQCLIDMGCFEVEQIPGLYVVQDALCSGYDAKFSMVAADYEWIVRYNITDVLPRIR